MWNPQANSILEKAHQIIGNILRTFQVNNYELEQDDPWSGILFVVFFTMRSTVHTTTHATPMQLVFGRNAIMNLTFNANWHLFKQCKHNLINKSNAKENIKWIDHTYKVDDLILVKNEPSTKDDKDAYNGPWMIQEVWDNATIEISKGPVSDVYNIQNITPYAQQSWIMGKCAINGVTINYGIAKLAYINNNAWLMSIKSPMPFLYPRD